MSYHTWTSYGYGICVDDIEGVTMKGLLELIHKAPEFEKEFLEWLAEIYEEPIEELEIDCVLEDWEDDCCYNGIAPILRDVINETENLSLYVAEDYDSVKYLLISPHYPWNEISTEEHSLSREQANEIFHKYLRILTDNDKKIDIDYQSVENGG